MTKPNTNHKTLAWIILIVLALIWGSSFILMKRGLEVFSPQQVGTLRIAIAFLSLFPFALPHLKKMSWHQWKYAFFVGLIGNLIPALLFATAQTSLDSGITGVLNALTPLFVILVGVIFFTQKIFKVQIVGIVISFVGAVGLALAKAGGGFGNLNIYALLVVGATFCYGISTNLVKFKLGNMKAVLISALAFCWVGPMSIAYLLTTDFVPLMQHNSQAWSALGYIGILGVVGTAIALVLFNKLIQLTSPIFTVMVTYLIPIVALAWGLLDGEKVFFQQYAAMILIIAGVYLVNNAKK